MKIFIILIIYLSLNISLAFADNNLKNERDKITKERNDLAIGWLHNLGYDLPVPGTSQLYNIVLASNGEFVNGIGVNIHLHNVMDGKRSKLSFNYRKCTETNGSPIAT